MKQFPKAAAFLQKNNMTVDEALTYLEEQEKESTKLKEEIGESGG